MKMLIDIFKVLLFIVVLVNNSIGQSGWNMINGNAQRTNYVAEEKDLIPPLKKESNVPVWGEYILINDNIFYLADGGTINTVTAFDYINNDTLWKIELPDSKGGIGCIPAISNDKIFIGGQQAAGLYALDKNTGTQKWFLPTGSQFSRSPVTDGNGHVFINTFTSDLLCLDENTGDTIWVVKSLGSGTPSFYDDKLFVCASNQLYAFNSKTGEKLWQQAHLDGSKGQILLDESGVYLCVNKTIAAYNIEDGTEKWKFEPEDTIHILSANLGAACLTDSVLCISLVNNSITNGRLITLNKFTGEKLWEYISDYPYIQPPVSANGYIYAINNYSNWLGSFNQMTGELNVEDESQNYWGMVIVNHRLYVLSQSGVSIFKTKTSSVDDNGNNDFLFDVFPNPCSDKIAINYKLPERGKTSIILYDLAGKQVKVLYNKVDYEGEHQLAFDELSLLPGAYVLVLKNNKITRLKKIVVTE